MKAKRRFSLAARHPAPTTTPKTDQEIFAEWNDFFKDQPTPERPPNPVSIPIERLPLDSALTQSEQQGVEVFTNLESYVPPLVGKSKQRRRGRKKLSKRKR